MMNMVQLSEQLKDFSKEQLANEMRQPSGSVPQFLVLTELQRRTRMEQDAARMQGRNQSTVAEDAVAAAGVPQAGIAGLARSMAPQTDTTNNAGATAGLGGMSPGGSMPPQGGAAPPVQRMQEGGLPGLGGPATATYQQWLDMSRSEREDAGLPTSVIGGQFHFNRFGVGLGRNDPETGARLTDVDPVASSGGSSQTRLNGRPAPSYTEEDLVGVSEGSRISRPGSRDEYPMYTEEDLARVSGGSEARTGTRDGYNMRPQMRPGEPFDMEDVADQFEEEANADDRMRAGDSELDTTTGGSGGGGAGGPGEGAGTASDGLFGDLDRMYEQDRWLALARFGLGLMSSDEPTFGGAIGDAGSQALDYMHGARGEMMDRRMQEMQMAIAQEELDIARMRATQGGSSDPYRGIGPRDYFGLWQDQLDALNTREETARMLLMMGGAEGPMRNGLISELDSIALERARIQAQLNSLGGLPAGPVGPATEQPIDVADR